MITDKHVQREPVLASSSVSESDKTELDWLRKTSKIAKAVFNGIPGNLKGTAQRQQLQIQV